MSVDTVNEALTRVRLRIVAHPQHYGPAGYSKLLAFCDVMRMQLMSEDAKGFNRYVDEILGREPDAADFLLEELFDELNCDVREDLDKALAA